MKPAAEKRQSTLPRAFDLPEPEEIIAFIRDMETRSALVAAFGGRSPMINIGGIETAIAYLTNDPSPRNLVVDVSGSAYPLEAVDRLADVCRPDTFVLAIGETNDIGFYHALRELGVAEYLVKPVSSESLRAVLTTARRQKSPAERGSPTPPSSQVIAVTGARGGVGATMLATTLAWFFAESARLRTMFVDLDLHFGSSALAFDVQPSRGLRDALTNPDRIDNLFVASASEEISENLCLLSTEEPLDSPITVKPDAVECLVKELRNNFQRVILDVPCRNLSLLRQGLAHANTLIVVSDFSLAGLRDAGRILNLAKDMTPKTNRLVVGNRAGGAKGEISGDQLEKILGSKLCATIPEDDSAVLNALNTGEPLLRSAPGSKASKALRSFAATFDDRTPAGPSFLSRILGAHKAGAE